MRVGIRVQGPLQMSWSGGYGEALRGDGDDFVQGLLIEDHSEQQGLNAKAIQHVK